MLTFNDCCGIYQVPTAKLTYHESVDFRHVRLGRYPILQCGPLNRIWGDRRRRCGLPMLRNDVVVIRSHDGYQADDSTG